MIIDLAAVDETGSLLVPAYGLTRSSYVTKADPEQDFSSGKVNYALLGRDDWYLQPRRLPDNILSQASAVFNEDIRSCGRRRVIRLRETSDQMPEGAENTCLMIQGTRTCVRKQGDRSQTVSGYAAWEAASADDWHDWVSHRIWSDEGCGLMLNKTVIFGRSGRGALYAPIGEDRTRILLIDFRIVKEDSEKPDILEYRASCTEVKNGEVPYWDPHNVRLNARWKALIARASQEYRAEHGL